MQWLFGQNAVHRRFRRLRRRRVSGWFRMAAHMQRERASRPQLRGISQVFGIRAGQVHDPSFGILADDRSVGAMIGILQRRLGSYG